MSRFALVCVLGACAALAPAAPVPPPSEKELIAKLWGTTGGAGKFELRGKELTIRAPMYTSTDNMPPFPYTVRAVRGDFVATVKLLDAAGPNEANRRAGSDHGTRAGLRVWCDGVWANLWLLQYHPERADGGASDTVHRQFSAELFHRAGGEGIDAGSPTDGTTQFLRIARRGDVLTFSTSADGKKWADPTAPRQRVSLPDELSVGVAVFTSTNRVASATFADLNIEPLKPEPKK